MPSLLEDILARVEPEHGRALEWFVEHENELGPRPWRQSGESIIAGVSFPVVAQRGIHPPKGWSTAISVTAGASNLYVDGKKILLGDGTWLLLYRAHEGRDGTGIESRWNRTLLSNLAEQIPVGVFVREGRAYRNLGLAMVEDYYAHQSTFLLRGPVRRSQDRVIWQLQAPRTSHQLFETAESRESTDLCVPQLVRRREAQDQFRAALLDAYDGKCAVTQTDAEPALQAAHILCYSGASSQIVTNGLLLRADIHLLYDRHLLSVDPEKHRVWLNDMLLCSTYRELQGVPLRAPIRTDLSPDPSKLAIHWAVFSDTDRQP